MFVRYRRIYLTLSIDMDVNRERLGMDFQRVLNQFADTGLHNCFNLFFSIRSRRSKKTHIFLQF